MNANFKEIAGMPKTVGGRLRFWRQSSMWTLMDVNQMIGVSQGSLFKMENNISQPSTLILTRLHQKTDLNICWLLTGMGPISSRSSYLNIKKDKNPREMDDVLIEILMKGGKSKKARLNGIRRRSA